MNSVNEFEVRFRAGRYEVRRQGWPGVVFGDSEEDVLEKAARHKWSHEQWAQRESRRLIEKRLRMMEVSHVNGT